ncbi:MAG: type VII secretion integral membrane protein EccD [Mycobacterium sp.]|uniref:type VII secretion integral membrane protein EccD n=1 Tax=Mycobacterium sp. TaxID=1785 RepID=UPI003C69C5B6
MHQAVGARRSAEPHRADEDFRRVVVCAGSRYVDLVLSAALPIGSLIPPIVDIAMAEYGHRSDPEAIRYQLSIPGNVALDPSKTLAQSGIRHGTVLMLTSSSTVFTPPRFDDVAEAISVSLASKARPWTRRAAQLVSALAASCLTATSAAILIGTAFATNDVRRGGAVVAAVAGFIVLLTALAAYRVFDDGPAGLTLGLAAGGFAALTGLLAVPGGLAAPNALLAAAAAATTATVMRVIGSRPTVFTTVACFAGIEAAAAAVGAVTSVPLPAIGAASAVISLIVVEASAALSIMLAGLSSHVTSGPDGVNDTLGAKAIHADSWLTSLIAAFSAAAALGAIGAAAGSIFADSPRWLGIAFATITGGVLLLRARSHADLARSVPLVAAGTATLSATLVITAVAYPPHTPYLAAVSTMLAGVALCLGFITQTAMLSPIGRRLVELLEYLAFAVVVPLAFWICGLYNAARGMNLP